MIGSGLLKIKSVYLFVWLPRYNYKNKTIKHETFLVPMKREQNKENFLFMSLLLNEQNLVNVFTQNTFSDIIYCLFIEV